MALDPTIILRAGDFKTPDYAQIMEQRSQIQGRNAALAKAQRDEAGAQARTTRLGQIGTQAAGGDLTGARAAAVAAGDFDLATHIGGLEEEQRKGVARKVGAAAPIAYQALKIPDLGQRKQFILSQAPNLLANGWTQEELAGVNPTDDLLQGYVAGGQTLAEMFGREDKQEDRNLRHEEAEASRLQARGNAYISAGLLPPGEGGAPAGVPGGGDIVARMLPITVHSESRGNPNAVSPKGARGLMQVMPTTNLDPGFGVKPAADGSEAERTRVGQDYLAAMMGRYDNDPAKAWAAYNAGPGRVDSALSRGKGNWLSMMPKETRDYVRTNVAALSGGGAATPGGLTRIPGGRLDRQDITDARAEAREARAEARDDRTVTRDQSKDTVTLRKEFDALPEVKNFKTARTAWQQVDAISRKKNPTAADDIAIIFSYMRMLDPNSVVREGEFATAQNAAGVPDQVRNMWNKAQDGTRLTESQRSGLRNSAATVYLPIRDTYNDRAGEYMGYARDAGINPDMVAKQYTREAAKRQNGTLSANVPTMTPEQARNAPKGTRFRTSDGRVMVRQ